jgi:calcium load-activated calcium channel
MIYSKPIYQTLTKDIESLARKVEQKREEGDTIDKVSKKKNVQMEDRLKALQSEMTTLKFKSTIMIGLFLIVTMSSLSNYFDGIPVARLPFEPISLIRSMTHRGLGGEDYTECSYIFIYMMASFLLRGNIQKIFGFEGPKISFNPFVP